MRRLIATIVLVALLGGCSNTEESVPAAATRDRTETPRNAAPVPDLAACPSAPAVEDDVGTWAEALAVPKPFQGMVKSDLDHLAVSTLEGGTVCVDRGWMAETSDFTVDHRFLSFGWSGYEAFGHILVDRAAAGTVIDTGAAPVFSPSGKLVAGLQVSEAGWGGLEGFSIWNVTPSGLTPLVDQTADADGVLPKFFWQEMWDWQIDNWVGESCLAISAASSEALDAVGEDFANAERTPFQARQADGWAIKEGPPEGCPQS